MKNNQQKSSPGGKRKGAGRPKGVPNKATAEFKELAASYTEAALIELARIAAEGESEPARVSAIKEIFDRAYGKATQGVDLSGSVQFAGLDVTIRR